MIPALLIENAVKHAFEKGFRLGHSVHTLIRDHTRIPEKVILPSPAGFKMVTLSAIIRIESCRGNCSILKLVSRKTEVLTQPLNYFEDLFCSHFFRVHRSCLINLNKIVAYPKKTGFLELEENHGAEVAVRRRASFFKHHKAHLA